MKYRDSIAVCLVFCLIDSAAGQDSAALDALFRQAAQRESGQGRPKEICRGSSALRAGGSPGTCPVDGAARVSAPVGTDVPQDLPGALALFTEAAKASSGFNSGGTAGLRKPITSRPVGLVID